MKRYGGARIFQGADTDTPNKSAIVVLDNKIVVTQHPRLTTNNVVVVGVRVGAREITLVSVYFEPDKPLDPYIELLREIKQKTGADRLIVGGDVNAKSTWWGSTLIDHRGEELCGTLEELGLNVLNVGTTPTFDTIRGGKRFSSHVDITSCSTDMLDLVDGWKIEEGLTSSDHNGIVFNIRVQRQTGTTILTTTRKFNTRKANWTEFRAKLSKFHEIDETKLENIKKIKSAEHLDKTIETITKIIDQTCNETIPIRKTTQKTTVPWWSDKLAEMKRGVATRKRRIRCAAPVRRAGVVEDYLTHKAEYELQATAAQVESWKEFCKKQDREGMWEGIYRVIGRTRSRGRRPTIRRKRGDVGRKGIREITCKHDVSGRPDGERLHPPSKNESRGRQSNGRGPK